MDQEVTLLLEVSTIPEWIRVLPLGRVELVDGREPFEVDWEALTAMVLAFQDRRVDLVVDYEHQSLQGDRAPAAGWIKALEARDDGLWARVEWTAQAEDYLRHREYRYFSPVLRLDQETRKPTELLHVGLTNVPAIKGLPPLVARFGALGEISYYGVTSPDSAASQGNQHHGRSAQEAWQERSQRYGIGVKPWGEPHKPVEVDMVPDELWGDPVNYQYPCHDYEAARAAWHLWSRGQQEQYGPDERSKIATRIRRLAQMHGFIVSPSEKEDQEVKEELPQKLDLSLDPGEEVGEGKAQDLLRDLALSLSLSDNADAAQVKAAVEVLKAASERLEVLQAELEYVKAELAEEKAVRVVKEAMKRGKISPAQKTWALEYCQRDPEGFQTYLAQMPAIVPLDVHLNLIRSDQDEGGLSPAELEICKQLNITVALYKAARHYPNTGLPSPA